MKKRNSFADSLLPSEIDQVGRILLSMILGMSTCMETDNGDILYIEQDMIGSSYISNAPLKC